MDWIELSKIYRPTRHILCHFGDGEVTAASARIVAAVMPWSTLPKFYPIQKLKLHKHQKFEQINNYFIAQNITEMHET